MQRRDLVVELLAALVEAAQAAHDGRLDEREVDVASTGRGDTELLDEIDEPSAVAVGVGDDRVAGRRRHRGARHRRRKRSVEQRCELVGLERFQNIDRGT